MFGLFAPSVMVAGADAVPFREPVSVWTWVLCSLGHTPHGGIAWSEGNSVTCLLRNRHFSKVAAVFLFLTLNLQMPVVLSGR